MKNNILTFKEFVLEKATNKINGGWHELALDDGMELTTNLELINKMKVQIAKPGERQTTNYQLNDKDTILDQFEKLLGQKLNLKDEKIKKFLELYPCPCRIK